jgi:hypothetical protein
MSTSGFFETEKLLVVESSLTPTYLQAESPTTLSFYIKEAISETVLSEVLYQVEKVSGRSTEVITPWTQLDVLGITNNLYTFDYTLTGVTPNSDILLKFKVVDEDGIEYFSTVKNIVVI